MSISDLKIRLADVPGIENLTMALEAGRIVLRWAGYSAAVDASASDYEIEVAIRNAIKLPAVSLIPDKPTPAAVPAPTIGVSSMSNPAAAGLSVKAMMDEHTRMMGEIHAAQLEILRTTLANQRNSVSTAVGSIASKIAAQTDEFNAMMGQYSNFSPESL
jgi:hypothetical protein